MHIQECFAYLGYKDGQFPESEAAAKQTLALPIYPELAEAQLKYVVECVREFMSEIAANSAAGAEALQYSKQ
jgi:dTDP-4-amino-4,6-dideoxygalactose transaminase